MANTCLRTSADITITASTQPLKAT